MTDPTTCPRCGAATIVQRLGAATWLECSNPECAIVVEAHRSAPELSIPDAVQQVLTRPRKPVRHHRDAEAANAIARIVQDRVDGHALFSTRYGIAGDVLAWLDEHRPNGLTTTAVGGER